MLSDRGVFDHHQTHSLSELLSVLLGSNRISWNITTYSAAYFNEENWLQTPSCQTPTALDISRPHCNSGSFCWHLQAVSQGKSASRLRAARQENQFRTIQKELIRRLHVVWVTFMWMCFLAKSTTMIDFECWFWLAAPFPSFWIFCWDAVPDRNGLLSPLVFFLYCFSIHRVSITANSINCTSWLYKNFIVI